ncbi:MerR family transcriptional regulator [Faecalimonas sp.]
MGEVHYMISEASKRVNVETHVLRYWEEELELPIGRTEMGHRYYTEENIQLFRCIKELKAQGMFLKDLKNMIPDILRLKEQKMAQTKEQTEMTVSKAQIVQDHKHEQLQTLLGQAFQHILEQNNKALEASVTKAVSEKVSKEISFLLEAKERQEEERFKKLDSLIRQQQTLRKEAGKSSATRKFRRLLGVGEI